MRRGFLFFFTVAFVLMFVVACTGEEAQKEEPAQEPTTEETTPKVEQTTKVEQTVTTEKDLPKSGGPMAPSMLLPVAALLLGSGVLAFTVLRHTR